MKVLASVLSLFVAATASAAVTSTTQHGALGNSLNGLVEAGDLISGLIPVELPGDLGWHNAVSGTLPVFTNDIGDGGLNGLLNDNAPNDPVKIVQYTLAAASDIGSIGILTGNDGQDGRVFSTTVISYSTDGGANFTDLGYFQSDPSGTLNNAKAWGSTHVAISDDASATLLAGVTDLIFTMYSVDNTLGEMRDPFDGVNPYTSVDDGMAAAFVSPLVWEIDVNAVPEPASLALLGLGGLAMLRRR